MDARNLDLVHVIQRLSSSRSLDAIVQVLRDTTRELTGADGITIVLRDGDKCFYAEENAIGPLWKGKRFPMSACISGWCMIHKEQVVIADIYKDARIPHDAYRPTFVKSLAMTPIRRSEPFGSIGAYWASEHVATPEELRILQTLGDSAAMALENSQLIDQLKSASERKDAFLSMLAHELRNPLTPVRNGLQLLRLQSEQGEPCDEAYDMIDRQVVHMTRIIDDLLDVARINNGKVSLKRDRVDLATLLRQCVNDHRPAIDQAALTLKLEIPAFPVWVAADSIRLSQVFGNLLNNACKYTRAGGTVAVRMTADARTRLATIDVADSGVGIAPLLLPRVFDSFTQADSSLDRAGGGLGLGLAVASGLVKLHDGTITAHSDGVGKGATFTVTLPDAEVTSGAPLRFTTDDKDKLHVLIIEDNRDTADSMQKLLKLCGYRTSVAYDGSKGVKLAFSENPDVILCDIGLPEMDGYEVASALRKSAETAGKRLIAITGYGSDEDRQKSRTAGFDAHMVKPVDLKSLLGEISVSATSLQ
jgi:signal transduction histidine kinase/ActR/RegA family two-component response regulator